MRHRAAWARIVLGIFLLGLFAGGYGLYSGNSTLTTYSVVFIVLSAIATYVLRKDFQRELDELEEKRKADSQAVDTQAVNTQPSDSQTIDTQAADTQSVDTQATDTQAADSQTVDTQAADSQAREPDSADSIDK